MKLFLILIIGYLFPQQILAKKLYKYKDQKGHLYYSDSPPQTNHKVEVKQLKGWHKQYIFLHKTEGESDQQYFVINDYYAPIEIKFFFTKSHNILSSPTLPKHFIVEPGKSDTLFKVAAAKKRKSWSYTIQYNYNIGSPLAKHDKKTIYFPPFPPKSYFQITQAFGGKFSHTDELNKYAVDIAMPVNTPIHAARAGVVVEVNNDFFKNGLTQVYKSRANSIRILHDDGSMAIYVHLALETTQVYEGLNVLAGQLIGYSGNTGYSTGPHLHFAVQLNKGMKLVSVPFEFSSIDGVSKPRIGNWLIRN